MNVQVRLKSTATHLFRKASAKLAHHCILGVMLSALNLPGAGLNVKSISPNKRIIYSGLG